MKKIKIFLAALTLLTLFLGSLQINETYAIPNCGEIPCMGNTSHYCDSTPCWYQGKIITCEIWCDLVK